MSKEINQATIGKLLKMHQPPKGWELQTCKHAKQ